MLETIELDLKDRKILYELDCNARQSNSQIAKKVGLSKEVVSYRIKRLVEKKVILGYYTYINTGKLGFLNFRVYLRFHNVTLEKETEIINYLTTTPSVGWAASVEGNWDLDFVHWSKSFEEFAIFWEKFLKAYRNYIENKWVSLFYKVYHFKKSYLIGKKGHEEKPDIIQPGSEIQIDDIDFKLLQLLDANARIPTVEIATKLGLSDKAVSYRIKNLVKNGIIQGFRIQLNLPLIGYEYHKVHLTLHNITEKRFNELFNYLSHHPNIIYLNDLTVGGSDFEFEPQVKGSLEFHDLIKDIRAKFSDIIWDFETMLYFEEHKLKFFPGNK